MATKTKKPAATKSGAAKKKTTAKATAPAKALEVKEQTPPAVAEEAQASAVAEPAAVPAPAAAKKAPAKKAAAKKEAPAKAAEAPAEAAQAAPAEAAETPAEEPAKAAEAPAEAAPAAPAEAARAARPEPRIRLVPNSDGSKLTEIVARPVNAGNPYKPMEATVLEVITESPNIKTIRVTLDDPEVARNFTYEPGQVGQLSVFGAGESTFVINSPPSQKDYLQFSVMQAGEVTTVIHNLCKGDKVGVRAPLGRPFPYQLWKGKKLFFIGGGIGMAPIRTIMLHCLEHSSEYEKISLLYGCRTPDLMPYKYELEDWLNRPDLDCTLTIDIESEGWPYEVGMIPNVLRKLNPSPDNCIAILCGPPVMIKFTLMALDELGFAHENVYTTLEKRMKCGIGICGRCGIGGKYVCLDGPVFSQKELDELPPEL